MRAIAAGTLKAPDLTAQQAQTILEKERTQSAATAGARTSAQIGPAEEKAKRLQQIKDFALTNTTKVMIERAPTVIYQANKVLHLLDIVRTGPGIGRWQEMMTTDAGFRNPEYRKLRTDLGLLTSAITQMHIGSRAVAQIAEQCVFRPNRTPIPDEADHRFRAKPNTRTGQGEHPRSEATLGRSTSLASSRSSSLSASTLLSV